MQSGTPSQSTEAVEAPEINTADSSLLPPSSAAAGMLNAGPHSAIHLPPPTAPPVHPTPQMQPIASDQAAPQFHPLEAPSRGRRLLMEDPTMPADPLQQQLLQHPMPAQQAQNQPLPRYPLQQHQQQAHGHHPPSGQQRSAHMPAGEEPPAQRQGSVPAAGLGQPFMPAGQPSGHPHMPAAGAGNNPLHSEMRPPMSVTYGSAVGASGLPQSQMRPLRQYQVHHQEAPQGGGQYPQGPYPQPPGGMSYAQGPYAPEPSRTATHNRTSMPVHGPRHYHSANPLSPPNDPMQSCSNLSTFSSLGYEGAAQPLDTARYSHSLSSFGSSGYSSGYVSRLQTSGAQMSGIMSTTQSLMSTGHSMSGMMSTGGGLMSTNHSGVWSDEGAMGPYARDPRDPRDASGTGVQAPGVSGVSLLDRVHLPPLIETSGEPPGVCQAHMHAMPGPFIVQLDTSQALPCPTLCSACP